MFIDAQGRRLWKTARMLGLLSAVCSVLGLLLMFLLCCVGSFSAASAGRLLVYMLLWLVPTAVLTFGLRRF